MSGKLTLISSATASDSASVEFTSGIDSTYDEYVFYFLDLAHDTNNEGLRVNFSSNGGSSYGIATTSTYFRAFHLQDGSVSGLGYKTAYDLANSTSPQTLTSEAEPTGDTASASSSGCFHLYSPSSTTYVKHFQSRFSVFITNPAELDGYSSGYVNTTSAINALKFDASSGTFSGQIHLFGIS
jgi:hypothetical protein